MSTIAKFEKFEVKNQSAILAGYGKITWVGKDERGNSLFDYVDSGSGREVCGVNDHDLTYNVGDIIYP